MYKLGQKADPWLKPYLFLVLVNDIKMDKMITKCYETNLVIDDSFLTLHTMDVPSCLEQTEIFNLIKHLF